MSDSNMLANLDAEYFRRVSTKSRQNNQAVRHAIEAAADAGLMDCTVDFVATSAIVRGLESRGFNVMRMPGKTWISWAAS